MLPLIHFGSIYIPTYYVVLSFTYCLCIAWTYKRALKYSNAMAKEAMDLGFLILLTGFIGARLGHIIFEAPEIYIQNPLRFFYFWEGGFVFYAGLLTSLASSLLYFKLKKTTSIEILKWLDFFAPVIALGYGLGRLACLTAGCCYGKVCNLPWAIQLPQVDGWPTLIQRHPTQLYASVIELFIIFPLVIFIEKLKFHPGRTFFIWLTLHGMARLFMEHYRDDFRGQFIYGFSISSWLSLLLIFISLVFLLRSREILRRERC